MFSNHEIHVAFNCFTGGLQKDIKPGIKKDLGVQIPFKCTVTEF